MKFTTAGLLITALLLSACGWAPPDGPIPLPPAASVPTPPSAASDTGITHCQAMVNGFSC
jgi:hypothetical protein